MAQSTNIEPVRLANAVLRVAFDEGIPLTVAQLQCLLFDLELSHRRNYGLPLIGARFTAAPFGPRIAAVDAQYGLNPENDVWHDELIRRFGKDAEGRAYCHYDLTIIGQIYLCLDETRELSVREHISTQRAEGTPWRSAHDASARFLDEDGITTFAGRMVCTAA